VPLYQSRCGALLRRQQLDELVEAPVEERPAALQVVDEAMRLVLRRDADAADAELRQFESEKSMMRNLPPKGPRASRAIR
jgi:hypothetical protein